MPSQLRFILMALLVCIPLVAQRTQDPAAVLSGLFEHPEVSDDAFDPQFLAHVSAARITQILKQLLSAYGPYKSVKSQGDGYSVVLEHGTVPAKIYLGVDGKITGLWFGPAVAAREGDTLDDVLKKFKALPGKKSLLLLEGDKERAALEADTPMAVGSAFKLAILAALQEEIANGKHRWEEVVRLQAKLKSLPTGVLQTWPDGTPLTLATLANQMISISDNTAADTLLDVAERRNVEKFAPRNRPFLSTSEAFFLKASANKALADRFRAADESGKRALLPEIDKHPAPDLQQLRNVFDSLDIEWFFTARELCTLMYKVDDQGAMQINPGLATPSQWKQIAFKGGSEPGVLNLTTGLLGKNGKHYCVAATWNNSAPVDEAGFFSLYSGLLSILARETAPSQQ